MEIGIFFAGFIVGGLAGMFAMALAAVARDDREDGV